MAVIGLYLVLACAPTSQYKDPTSSAEVSTSSIDAEIAKATDDGAPVEDGYHEGDKGLITNYYQIYSQAKELGHTDVSVVYKDLCHISIKTDVIDSSGTATSKVVTYLLDKPECSSPATAQTNSVFQKLSNNESMSFKRNDSSEEIPKRYYGLTVVKYNKTIPNCSQYPGCVAEFTRIEFDEIRYPDNEKLRDRHHHVMELSKKVPAIVRLYSHCDSHIIEDSDGRKLPVTECAAVTDFMGGQTVPLPTSTPLPSPSPSPH